MEKSLFETYLEAVKKPYGDFLFGEVRRKNEEDVSQETKLLYYLKDYIRDNNPTKLKNFFERVRNVIRSKSQFPKDYLEVIKAPVGKKVYRAVLRVNPNVYSQVKKLIKKVLIKKQKQVYILKILFIYPPILKEFLLGQ